jgi:formiminotetrahydrofolate cyclodeaminase
MPMPATPGIADERLCDLFESFAARTPAPGGGAAAGVAAALAAALCSMAARFSTSRLATAEELAITADALRSRALRLAGEDAAAYASVLAARRLPIDNDPSVRNEAIARAMAYAVAVPREIAEVAAEVARIASDLSLAGNPNLLGDAVTARLLAEAAGGAATKLIEINLSGQPQTSEAGQARGEGPTTS